MGQVPGLRRQPVIPSEASESMRTSDQYGTIMEGIYQFRWNQTGLCPKELK